MISLIRWAPTSYRSHHNQLVSILSVGSYLLSAATQEKFQLEHNTMAAKNYADDVLATNTKKWHDATSQINMKNGGTTPFKTVTNARLDTMYAQPSAPLGPSDATFVNYMFRMLSKTCFYYY
jgi:hypothetical protein